MADVRSSHGDGGAFMHIATRQVILLFLGLSLGTVLASCSEDDAPSGNAAGLAASETSPPISFVETSALDDPDIDATVYWLGEHFDPGGDLPALPLVAAYGPVRAGQGPPDV